MAKPTIEVTYSKKLGLPNFSSHSLTVSIKTEIDNVAEAQGQTSLLYGLLQASVDEEMRHVGFMPDPKTYGRELRETPARAVAGSEHHACTPAQRSMIIALAHQHELNKAAVDALASEKFGVGVRELNQQQAAGFIKELRGK